MKINWSSVAEMMIALLASGLILVALNGLFFHHLAEVGEGIHGTPAPAKVA